MNCLQAGKRVNNQFGRSLHFGGVPNYRVIPRTRGVLLKIALVAFGVCVIGGTQAGELSARHDQPQLTALVVGQKAALPQVAVAHGKVSPSDGRGERSPGVVPPLEPVVKEPGDNASAKADDGSGGRVEQDSEQRTRYSWQFHLGILLASVAAGWFVPSSAVYFLLGLFARIFRR